FGSFFEGHDQTALMIWLAVLVPLVSAGRPWGSQAFNSATKTDFVNSSTPRGDCGSLTPGQKAAILFMSLPPERSAQLFSELGPESVQSITLEITQLPFIDPEARAGVLNEFLVVGCG